jgi:exodeoxyribonuclease-1
MQFAGQRTDMDLKPVGEPDNFLIKITQDILPDPDAVLITGITPQQTLADGINEADFLKHFSEKIATPHTIFVGFNSVRFDDEFMRFSLWRNFYDAYEWQWKNGNSRWDILDLTRITRALRPEGIKWPFASDGKASNRLELISSVNKLDHVDAHDALSDVNATIAVARLIMNKQPKLFDFMLNMRGKTQVAALVNKAEPIVYTSGKYPPEHEKTTVAVMVAAHPSSGAALMYDLRIDPDEFARLTPEQLAALWQLRGKDAPYFPVKVLKYNRCPAIAPTTVLDAKSATRLKIDSAEIDSNLKKLLSHKDFGDKLVAAIEFMNKASQPELIPNEQLVDGQLYDGFVNDNDRTKMSVVRAADANELANLSLDFVDDRLKLLLPLYKARNYPKSLSENEQESWEQFRTKKLFDGGNGSAAARYFKRIEELAQEPKLNDQKRYLLEELKLYGESILPLE